MYVCNYCPLFCHGSSLWPYLYLYLHLPSFLSLVLSLIPYTPLLFLACSSIPCKLCPPILSYPLLFFHPLYCIAPFQLNYFLTLTNPYPFNPSLLLSYQPFVLSINQSLPISLPFLYPHIFLSHYRHHYTPSRLL